jgi:hypothetical protein
LTSATPPGPRDGWQAIEPWLVVLIAIHSAAIGLVAVVATEWGIRFSGFESASPLFFPRQVGVFHVVVAFAYLIEWFRYRGVAILVTTKAIAVAFLGTMMAVSPSPWVVPLSALGDAAMCAAVLVVHRQASRWEGRSGARPGRPGGA